MSFDVDAWFNQNAGNTGASDGPVGSLINRVYLGEAGPKQVRMKRGGQAVTIPAGLVLMLTQSKLGLSGTLP